MGLINLRQIDKDISQDPYIRYFTNPSHPTKYNIKKELCFWWVNGYIKNIRVSNIQYTALTRNKTWIKITKLEFDNSKYNDDNKEWF